MSDTPQQTSESTSAAQACSLDGKVSLHDCLREINHALNYWYPIRGMEGADDASELECHARHVRLFEFRDRLERQVKANDESSDLRSGGVRKSEQREPQVRCDDWLGEATDKSGAPDSKRSGRSGVGGDSKPSTPI